MSELPRAVIHIDLDAFFAAVEILENPELEGKPVVVGGSPTGRGVVTSASYEARAFGVKSAMPMFRALQLCPDAVVVSGPYHRYSDYSKQVMDLVRQTSSQVEQMSIDEACLELTDEIKAWDQAVWAARRLQRQVLEKTGLSASLGVATSKLVAKVASDFDKPGGLTVVRPGEEEQFLAPLPVRVLWGIGPVTAARLAEAEVHTVGDLQKLSKQELWKLFGKHGEGIARMARGKDSRRVAAGRRSRSMSHERTFQKDVADSKELLEQIDKLSFNIAKRLKRRKLAARVIAIKIRYGDFSTLTRQMALAEPTEEGETISRTAQLMFERHWVQGRAVRLIGVSGRDLCKPTGQMSLL
ncbi:MAG: DNA polymerase IV [Chloroflexota bacterium]